MDPNASDSHDVILGGLALRKGIVTPAQLRESLILKTRAAEVGFDATLPEIFLKRGYATREQVQALERDREFHRARVEEEEALGGRALAEGLVDAGSLGAALERLRLDPLGPPLDRLLLESGAIAEAAAARIAGLRRERLRKASGELLGTLADAAPPAGAAAPGGVPPPAEGAPAVPRAAPTAAPDAAGLPGLKTLAEGEGIRRTPEGKPILGEYEVVREIGRGAMGVVYEAIQKTLNRRVALKVLPPELVMNENRVKRFRQEAEAAARLDHPGIVKVFGMGEQGGIHYFAMEYIEGKTFEALIDEGDLPVRKACKLIVQAAEALHYAHEKGVIHRDIKPANVMVQDDGTVRVMDFGLARQEANESSLTASGTVLGTPAYMSPEQAGGQKGAVDRRADVYSLGATLYEMLTSEAPIPIGPEDGIREVLRRIVETEPAAPQRLNRKVPLNLSTVVLKALAKDLPRRYATAAEFREDLERFLRGDPVLARPVGPLTRAWMRLLKHKTLAALAAALALTAVLVPSLALRLRAQALRESPERKIEEAEAALAAADFARAAAQAEYVVKTSADRALAVRGQRILCEILLGGEEAALFGALARLHSMDRRGPVGHWALARILERLLREKKSVPALALATRIWEAIPDDSQRAYALEARAGLLLERGSLNEARAAYARLLSAGAGGEEARRRLDRLLPYTPIVDLPVHAESVGVGDLDGDGRNELAAGGSYEVRVFRRKGREMEEALSLKVSDVLKGIVGAVRIGDADNDGRAELAVAYGQAHLTEAGALEIWKWDGSGLRLAWRHPLHGTSLWHGALLVDDLDGDGSKEVALGMLWFGRRVDFFRCGPDGWRPYSSWMSERPPWNSDVYGLAVGPVGKDRPQVAAALGHWNGYGIVTIEGEPGSDRFFATSERILGELLGVCMADLDGDGRCEIVTGKRFTHNTVLFGPGKPHGEVLAEDLFVLKYQPGRLPVVAGADLAPNESSAGFLYAAAGDADGRPGNEILALYTAAGEGNRPVERVDLFRLVEGEIGSELEREEILKIDMPGGVFPHRFCELADVDGDGKNEIVLFGPGGIKILGFD